MQQFSIKNLIPACTALVLAVGAIVALAPAPSTHALQPAGPAGKSCVQRTFSTRTNRTSKCVAIIQSMLNLTNGAKLTPDSKFGSRTKTAVIKWQQSEQILVDGIVGKQTWKTLCDVGTSDVSLNGLKKEAGC